MHASLDLSSVVFSQIVSKPCDQWTNILIGPQFKCSQVVQLVYYNSSSMVLKHPSHWVICEHHLPNRGLMVQDKCLTYDSSRGAGLGKSADPRGSTEHLAVWPCSILITWSAGSLIWTAAQSQPVNLTLFIHLNSCRGLAYHFLFYNQTIMAYFIVFGQWDWSTGLTSLSYY